MQELVLELKHKMIIKKNKFNKIILFGGSIILLEVAKFLKNKKYSVKVFSSKRLLDDVINSKGSLKKNLKTEKIYFISTNDINKCNELKKTVNSNSLGIGFGETWSFNKNTIDLFNGYLFDYMGIPLPRYRGGAHFTWMMLQQERFNGACLQIINQDMVQGVFDSGGIVLEISFKNKLKWKINDYFKKQSEISKKLILKFLNKIEKNNIKIKNIDESKSYYLPRLNTKFNGWINWYTWNTDNIIKFINAFDDPYDGSSSMIKGERVFIKNAKLKKKLQFHPFQSGLICNINKNLYDIISLNGIITAEIFHTKKKKIKINLGDRIYTPIYQIEQSMTFRPEYSSDGLIKK